MTEPLHLITRQHKSGNSYSVRLPKQAAYDDPEQELELIVDGDRRILRPKPKLGADEFFRLLDELGPSQLGPESLARPDVRNPHEPR